MPSSPAHDISGFSRHRSVLMENQLDLNESEIDYYEEVVNDLVEKLDKLKEEKDDLQSICNGLGERLHKLGQDHEDEIQRNNAEFSSHMNTLFDKLQTVSLITLSAYYYIVLIRFYY